MNDERQDLRDRTKAFAIQVIRMFSSLPKSTKSPGDGEAGSPLQNIGRRQLPRGLPCQVKSRIHSQVGRLSKKSSMKAATGLSCWQKLEQ